jgi:hypothetical protein
MPLRIIYASTTATERRTPASCCYLPLEGESGEKQPPTTRPMPTPSDKPRPMSTTSILAVMGGITVILTAAVRIPAALAEFLRACILVAAAARELRAALTKRSPHDDPVHAGNPDQSCR